MSEKQNPDCVVDDNTTIDMALLDICAAIEEIEAYGTTTGVLKEWDERGRGRAQPLGEWETRPNETSTEAGQRKFAFAQKVWAEAERQGYPKGKVVTNFNDKQFNVGGKIFDAAGEAQLDSGLITIFANHVDDNTLGPVMAHEINHQKFQKVLDAVAWDHKVWMNDAKKQLDSRDSVSSRTQPEDVMTSAGFFNHTPANDAKYPIVSRFDNVYDGYEKIGKGYMPSDYESRSARLYKDDGVSDYSKQWWQAWNDGKATTEQAMHETVAEIARLSYENGGKIPAIVKPSWKAYYQAVQDTYREITPQKAKAAA